MQLADQAKLYKGRELVCIYIDFAGLYNEILEQIHASKSRYLKNSWKDASISETFPRSRILEHIHKLCLQI